MTKWTWMMVLGIQTQFWLYGIGSLSEQSCYKLCLESERRQHVFWDYVTFQLSCFHELHFQSLPYFASWISHFKGNNFWVRLAYFDEFWA